MAVVEAPAGIRIPFWPWGFAAVALIATVAVLVAPLAGYVFLIALFGLPHVVCEMRYCDERFSARAPRLALGLIAVLLALLAFLRIGDAEGLVSGTYAAPLELGLGIGLVAAALWHMRVHRLVGALAGLLLAAGAAFAPIATFLAYSWVHNLTPLGFVAEIVPARERTRWLATLAIPFLVLPALIASGLPQAALAQVWPGEALRSLSLFGAGRGPMGSFVSPDIAFDRALPLFSAAVVAQAMHYFAVIGILPRLLARYGASRKQVTLAPWPSWRHFYIAVAVLGALMLAFNALDYSNAKLVYSVCAAMHAWVELPIFLIALGAGFTAMRRSPRP